MKSEQQCKIVLLYVLFCSVAVFTIHTNKERENERILERIQISLVYNIVFFLHTAHNLNVYSRRTLRRTKLIKVESEAARYWSDLRCHVTERILRMRIAFTRPLFPTSYVSLFHVSFFFLLSQFFFLFLSFSLCFSVLSRSSIYQNSMNLLIIK